MSEIRPVARVRPLPRRDAHAAPKLVIKNDFQRVIPQPSPRFALRFYASASRRPVPRGLWR